MREAPATRLPPPPSLPPSSLPPPIPHTPRPGAVRANPFFSLAACAAPPFARAVAGCGGQRPPAAAIPPPLFLLLPGRPRPRRRMQSLRMPPSACCVRGGPLDTAFPPSGVHCERVLHIFGNSTPNASPQARTHSVSRRLSGGQLKSGQPATLLYRPPVAHRSSGVDGRAAVGVQRGAGEEGGVLAGQEDVGGRDLRRGARATTSDVGQRTGAAAAGAGSSAVATTSSYY